MYCVPCAFRAEVTSDEIEFGSRHENRVSHSLLFGKKRNGYLSMACFTADDRFEQSDGDKLSDPLCFHGRITHLMNNDWELWIDRRAMCR